MVAADPVLCSLASLRSTCMSMQFASTSSDKKGVLVSVGVPTFNRPDGLRRTLNQILAQTHENLEVIVSDNASEDIEVERVANEFAVKDKRVQYIRQPRNIGAMANFKYVLQHAGGEYFMWAADDDEWSPAFVETCLAASISGESVGCKFDTLFRASGRRDSNPMPELDPSFGVLSNLRGFLACMQPSLIYGLHRKSSLEFLHHLPPFDFIDCYLVIRQIVSSGFRTVQDVLYVAGVDAPVYEIKYADEHTKKFDYATFFLRTALLFPFAKGMTLKEKRSAIGLLWETMCGLIKHHESCADPRKILISQIRQRWFRVLAPWRFA